VALLLKACPLLSGVSAYAADAGGSFTAAQDNLSGSHVTMVSMYAPVERQEQAPFLQQSLLYAMPIDTPLFPGGDWDCVKEGSDLVGGQPASLELARCLQVLASASEGVHAHSYQQSILSQN